jgi:hypothetical protein
MEKIGNKHLQNQCLWVKMYMLKIKRGMLQYSKNIPLMFSMVCLILALRQTSC